MVPGFKVDFEPDFRQKIADTWTRSVDDSEARRDWGHSVDTNIEELAKRIMKNIAPEHKKGVDIKY